MYYQKKKKKKKKKRVLLGGSTINIFFCGMWNENIIITIN